MQNAIYAHDEVKVKIEIIIHLENFTNYLLIKKSLFYAMTFIGKLLML